MQSVGMEKLAEACYTRHQSPASFPILCTNYCWTASGMFEQFPFLEGKYLGYASYFALIFTFGSLLQALLASCFWCWASKLGYRRKADAKEIVFEELLGPPGAALSGGERKRPSVLAMVCAYDTNPKVHVGLNAIIVLQSLVMFIIVSLLSFGGSGDTMLYSFLATVSWLLIACTVYYFDVKRGVLLYQACQSVALVLVVFWGVVALLQLPAWDHVGAVLSTLLVSTPMVAYGLCRSKGSADGLGEIAKNLRAGIFRNLCSRQQAAVWKTAAASLTVALFSVLLVDNSCIAFFNPGMHGVHVSVLSWNSWFTRLFDGAACPKGSDKPCHLYLTLPEDGSRSMFINMHTAWGEGPGALRVEYWVKGNKPSPPLSQDFVPYQIDWLEANGKRTVHSTLLTNLMPGTTYQFTIPSYKGSFSFRTLHDSTEPVSFMTGGDSGTTKAFQDLLEVSAQPRGRQKKTIDFVLIGGDVSYGNNLPACYKCWDEWISLYERTMVRGDGTMVPVSMAVGNHDVGSNSGSNAFSGIFVPEKKLFWKGTFVPMFFAFFPQHAAADDPKSPPPMQERLPYHYHKVGQSMAIFVLDSGHVVTYHEQRTWAEAILKSLPSGTLKFASYHVPIYPSTRAWDSPYDDRRQLRHAPTTRRVGAAAVGPVQIGLESWVRPLFDTYHFAAAFENHQHTFKRTQPMTDSKFSDTGTIYLGDGNLGIPGDHHRVPNPLIAKMAGVNHAWLVDTDSKTSNFTAVLPDGSVFDFVSRPRLVVGK